MSPEDIEDIPIILLPEDETLDGDGPPEGEDPGDRSTPGSPAPEIARPQKPRLRSQFWKSFAALRSYYVISGVVIASLAALFVVGWSYYTMPVVERPFHTYHQVLRPSGRLGLILAIAGSALMVFNLSYLVRKRLLSIRWLGPLRYWMSLHVTTGLLGPALILFHSAFAPYSALGVFSFSAMLIVVLTGLVGRYVYAHTPRSLEGHELELDGIKKQLAERREQLSQLGVDSSLLGPEQGPVPLERSAGFIGTFAAIVWGDRESHREYQRLKVLVRSSPVLSQRARSVLPLLRVMCKERQWLARYHEIRALMASWRFLHRWLAVLMLLVAFFHVAVAAVFGNLWIFQEAR